MPAARLVSVGTYMARRPRHQPEGIGLALDAGEWANIADLLARAAADGFLFVSNAGLPTSLKGSFLSLVATPQEDGLP